MSVLHGAMLLLAAHPTGPDIGTFAVAAAIVLTGGVGVVVSRNPVHAALMLVMTLFGIAVLFVLQQAYFLAAVQVIVYAGAIVVLFLFVIMFLGVDRQENLAAEPLRGQRPVAVVLGLLGLGGTLALGFVSHWTTGARSVSGAANAPGGDVANIGKSVFTTYLFPFEITAALLVIAVVGAVVLARRPPGATAERAIAEQAAADGRGALGVPGPEAAEPDGAPGEAAAGGGGAPDEDAEAPAPADEEVAP